MKSRRVLRDFEDVNIMSDQNKLKKAVELYNLGEYDEARSLLEAITTHDPSIRINVLLAMLGVLDHVTEGDKLLAVANEGIEIAKRTGNESVQSFLLGKKCFFLGLKLSDLIYRQRNLVLASEVFGWIGFATEKDKQEYEAIVEKRKELEQEINTTLSLVIERAERGLDHEFRGHAFSTIGDIYSHKYLTDKLDFQKGGKLKAKIANTYFVRRWNLDMYLYTREERQKIKASRDKCIQYFERAIVEFKLANKTSEQAHTIYNLATKMPSFQYFRRANKLLKEARAITDPTTDKPLLDKINKFEKDIADKNRNLRDYVREMGLDMPDGQHPSL